MASSTHSYLSELLQLYSPSRSLRSSSETRMPTPPPKKKKKKNHSYTSTAKLMVFALSPASDLTSRTSPKTPPLTRCTCMYSICIVQRFGPQGWRFAIFLHYYYYYYYYYCCCCCVETRYNIRSHADLQSSHTCRRRIRKKMKLYEIARQKLKIQIFWQLAKHARIYPEVHQIF